MDEKKGSARKICPPLEKLPPTDDSFREHVKRAMFQLRIWLDADKAQPTQTIDPLDWGWHTVDSYLIPTTTPEGTPIAPDSVLKIIRCNCKSVNDRCGDKSRCSCATNSLPCTRFCNCDFDGSVCPRTVEKTIETENEDDC